MVVVGYKYKRHATYTSSYFNIIYSSFSENGYMYVAGIQPEIEHSVRSPVTPPPNTSTNLTNLFIFIQNKMDNEIRAILSAEIKLI